MGNKHGDRKSPKDRVDPLPNGLFMAYRLINGCDPNHVSKSCDDPPSWVQKFTMLLESTAV